MSGAHKITKDYHDTAFVKLMHDMDQNKVKHELSSFFTRPVYQYTKAEVGAIK